MMRKQQQPWINTAGYDMLFILLPPFMALAATLMLPPAYRQGQAMPVAAWVVLVLCIDVAHVYSTLFNTYFDKERFARRRALFLLVPLGCYVAGVVLHLFSGLLFWRVLAYLAVFHFVRQQYGFVRLYSRNEEGNAGKLIDALAIYSATLYPLVYWHFTPGRNFNWFVDGDFLQLESAAVVSTAKWIYLAILAVYLARELSNAIKHRQINIPRNMVMAGSYLSWYFGIIYFNGDLAFTLLNVVSHGVPYMALVWSGVRKNTSSGSVSKLVSKSYGVLVFIGALLLFAYLEEGVWDGLVWREHGQVFGWFARLTPVDNSFLLAFLVPLLSLPQSTHYVLDGFIWRKKYK